MLLMLCFPLLDLRFLSDPLHAPAPPRWMTQQEKHAFKTVGSLGPVLYTHTGATEAEVRINASFLFEPEFRWPRRRSKRRWLERPIIGSDFAVVGRHLLADSKGHVRVEIQFERQEAEDDGLVDLLNDLLVVPVEIPYQNGTELILAGYDFAKLYLRESAKTAASSAAELADSLVQEGKGSPFVVILRDRPLTGDDGVALQPTPRDFASVRFSIMDLAGQMLGVWQSVGTKRLTDFIVHARHLCRLISYLSDTTLVSHLQEHGGSSNISFDTMEMTEFFRTRSSYLKRRSLGVWPVRPVLALANNHVRQSIDPSVDIQRLFTELHSSLANDVTRQLRSIEADSAELKVEATRPEREGHMRHEDKATLADILAKEAMATPDPTEYFRSIVRRAHLSFAFRVQASDLVSRNPLDTAHCIIDWSLTKGVNPEDSRFATLGSLINPLLDEVGLQKAITLVSMELSYELVRDKRLAETLCERYQVPRRLRRPADQAKPGHGPEIDWRGPASRDELQGWLRPEPPDFLDLGFLIKAIDCSRSVCLVTVGGVRSGTGVLIGPALVLTNHHVLVPSGNVEDSRKDAPSVTLHFGTYSPDAGSGTRQTFALDKAEPVLEWSPSNELDFVLLRVEASITNVPQLKPALLGENVPSLGSGLSILQHPGGGDMKLAISDDAVTFVDGATGRIQYVTRTANGSSGSPCFDEDWSMIALHHSERAKSIGTFREGILIARIKERIRMHLE